SQEEDERWLEVSSRWTSMDSLVGSRFPSATPPFLRSFPSLAVDINRQGITHNVPGLPNPTAWRGPCLAGTVTSRGLQRRPRKRPKPANHQLGAAARPASPVGVSCPLHLPATYH